jgi:hypothetical protein
MDLFWSRDKIFCKGYIFRRTCHSTVIRDKFIRLLLLKGKGRVPEVAPFIYFLVL